jgi:hypothetical protein
MDNVQNCDSYINIQHLHFSNSINWSIDRVGEVKVLLHRRTKEQTFSVNIPLSQTYRSYFIVYFRKDVYRAKYCQ